MGQYDKALPLYRRALAIAEKAGNPELAWSLQGNFMALHGLAKPQGQSLHNSALAIWYGKQAVNTLQSVRGQMKGLDRESQGSFLKKNQSTYETLANLLVEAGRLAEAEQVLAMLKEHELAELTRGSDSQTPQRLQADYVGAELGAAEQYHRLTSAAVRDAVRISANVTDDFGNVTDLGFGAGLRG